MKKHYEAKLKFIQAETIFLQAVSIKDKNLMNEAEQAMRYHRKGYYKVTGRNIDADLCPPGSNYKSSEAYEIRENKSWPHPSEIKGDQKVIQRELI